MTIPNRPTASAASAEASLTSALAGGAIALWMIALICGGGEGAEAGLAATFWRWIAALAMALTLFALGAATARRFLPDFADRGPLVGAARVAYQSWRVYWLHIGASLVAAAALTGLSASGGLSRWGLAPLVQPDGIVALLSLSFLPEQLALIPLAAAALAMGIAVLALGARSPAAALMIASALFLAASQPWRAPSPAGVMAPLGGGWPANPFAWQIFFVLGAAFAGRWLPLPPADRRLALAAAATLALAPLSPQAGAPAWPLGLAEPLAAGSALYLLAFAAERLDLGWIERMARGIGERPYAALGAAATLAPILESLARETALPAPLSHGAAALIGAALLAAAAHAAGFFLRQPWRAPPRPARSA